MRSLLAWTAIVACVAAAAAPRRFEGAFKGRDVMSDNAASRGPYASHTAGKRQSFPENGDFEWLSSDPLIYPKNDSREIKGVKDPSIIHYNGKFHVFFSTAVSAGYSLAYTSFYKFEDANNASFYYLDQSPLGEGYRAAPEVFYFRPHKLWYLIYQDGNAAYSTNEDIEDPSGELMTAYIRRAHTDSIQAGPRPSTSTPMCLPL
jgi:hypothetical protein